MSLSKAQSRSIALANYSLQNDSPTGIGQRVDAKGLGAPWSRQHDAAAVAINVSGGVPRVDHQVDRFDELAVVHRVVIGHDQDRIEAGRKFGGLPGDALAPCQ